jgi:monoterpene epsilon-lactone hydrolase
MNKVSIEDGITLPSRFIPWPSGISQQALKKLKEFTIHDVRNEITYPNVDDAAGWRKFIKEINEAILANSPMYGVSERPGVSSETTKIAGVTVHIATPSEMAEEARGKVFLELHGGGLLFLEGEGTRRGALREAERLHVKTISIDYRVPPDHPYPAALDDSVGVYSAVVDEYGAQNVIVGGISGGGNLAAALILRARDQGKPLPRAAILLTPEVDLTESGDTFDTLAALDPILRGRLTPDIAAYARGADLSHPYLSPIFGDFSKGYPPTFLQSGTRDMFLSNTVRMHRALRSAGIAAELHVWEGMIHGGFQGAPEDDEITLEMRHFIHKQWSS